MYGRVILPTFTSPKSATGNVREDRLHPVVTHAQLKTKLKNPRTLGCNRHVISTPRGVGPIVPYWLLM